MAHQVKLKMWNQQRYDLPDFDTQQNHVFDDFMRLNRGVFVKENSYIVSGFSVVGTGGLNIRVLLEGSVLLHGQYEGILHYVPTGEPPADLACIDGHANYIWAEVDTEITNPQVRTFWDPTALDGKGAEFQKVVDCTEELTVTIHSDPVSFGAGPNVIPICVATAAGGVITAFTDARRMLWRLGSGGAAPDIDHVYPWPDGRAEPGGSGGSDSVFFGGDKQLACMKDWMDAVMSIIKEIKFGTATGVDAVWYAPTYNSLSDMGVDMTDGGVWTWTLGTSQLAFTADAVILIPGSGYINYIRNTSSPLVGLTANDMVAYIDINRTSNADLAVSYSDILTFSPQPDRFIVARRTNDAVFIGIK